jgi:imidazolonepropionase
MNDQITLVVRDIGALVTCDPDRGDAPGVINDAVLMCAGERISYAGPRRGALFPPLTGDVIDIDARGAAVIPGFVDAHTHIAWLGDRGEEYALRSSGVSYEEIARGGGGIRSTVRSTAAGSVETICDAAGHRARRMIEHGSTTVEVKSGYGLDLDAELRQLDAVLGLDERDDLPHAVATYLALHATPDGDREQFIADVCERGVQEAAVRAAFCDVFCDEEAYTVEECRRVLLAARKAGMSLKIHAEQRSHSGGAQLAAELHATSADHLEHAGDDDLRALAAAGVIGVILPSAALVLGGPPPPGGRLRDAGATVAIATDCNPGTSYAESMPLMISLAVATSGLSPAEALVAATSGGAAALELADRGILRAGLRCDAVVLSTAHWIDVAYHLGANPVATVIRTGQVVVEGGAAIVGA